MADQSVPIGGTLDLTPQRVERPLWLEVLHDWVITVDHKKLGLMYMMMAIFFLLVGGAEVLCIRIQLIQPDMHFLSPQVFNRLFTMHGTTMVFLVGIPLVFAFANYIVPLQIGARDMAFPRLNAFSFWLTLFGGLLLYYSFIGGPRALRNRKRARRHLVGLRAADRKSLLARKCHRLLGPGPYLYRVRNSRRWDQ